MLFVPLALAADWPVSLPEESQVTQRDEDGDGVPETRIEGSEGGSGGHHWSSCVRHGASGHVVCEESASSAYSAFSGFRRVLVPATGNRAAPLMPEAPCAKGVPGALSALRANAPKEGEFVPTLAWRPGKPPVQESVCMTAAEAATYPSGLAWAGDSADGWSVFWSARGPQIWGNEKDAFVPVKVATYGRFEVWRQGHALAVYEPAANRHAWIASWGDGTNEGFKVDRWERIQSVEATTGGVRVTLATTDGPTSLLIRLPT